MLLSLSQALLVVPLVGGCAVGSLALKVIRLSLFLVGAVSGGVLGLYAYNLCMRGYSDAGSSVDWVYWACLGVPALAVGFSATEQEDKIIAGLTSLVGGFTFMIGVDSECVRARVRVCARARVCVRACVNVCVAAATAQD